MNKNSQEVIAKIRSVCESKAEVMLAKLNGVDTSIMRGKLKSAKELTKTLMESESRFWTDEKVAPSSTEFKVRFATLLTGYVICNLDRYIETYYMTVTQTEDRESVNLKELMNEILDLIQDMCKSAVNGSSRFYEVIYTLAVVDVVSNKPEHKRYKRLKKIRNSMESLTLRLTSDADEDETFGGLLRLTYVFCTRVPSAKNVKLYVEGYEFNQKATTYRMIEKLGKVIEETIAKVGVSRIFYIYMQCNPAITTRWTRGVSVNKNLALGCLALSYMKFLNNGTPIGDLCFWLK